MPISPGVYTKVYQIQSFVQQVPSSIGMVCALTDKGKDNVLTFLGNRQNLLSEFGEPNYTKYGKHYGQGLYCAYNFLGESGSLYFMRVLPDDASYALVRVDLNMDLTDLSQSNGTISLTYINNVNNEDELKTNLDDVDPTVHPIVILRPIGRGEYYNKISIRIIRHANPLRDGVYVLDIYEQQDDGNNVIIESFDISFDPNAKDSSGESLFISDVLERYSSILKADTINASDSYSDGINLIGKIYDNNVGNVSVDTTQGTASLTDDKQNFLDWQENANEALYSITAIDAFGNKIMGWLGAASGTDNNTISVYNGRDLTTAAQNWLKEDSPGVWSDFDPTNDNFDTTSIISYVVRKGINVIDEAFTSGNPAPLRNGSDGSLKDATGNINTTVADQILSNAYAGFIDSKVLDTENTYFNLVFDCGYNDAVKGSINNLVKTRQDCLAVVDNGDNKSLTDSLNARNTIHTYNTFLVSIFENYSKVYDMFTGKSIWVSPVYHMSYLLPRNDRVSEVWTATAGFNRGIVDNVEEIRFNPSSTGERDQLYLKQINPIVKFEPGYTIFSQLTSQTRPGPLQDINITRLYLYCKRALELYTKYYIFEQNDQFTWSSVQSDIRQFLEDIKDRRGLYSYSIDVGATEYELKTKTFHVNVTLFPTRTSEKILLNFFIK